jgi:disulfide bond formation protein DsbB
MTARFLRADRIVLGLGIFSAAMIAGALGFQYLGHLAPCEMCQWQRWPHFAAAFLGIGGAFLARGQARLLAGLVIGLVLISGLIGAYQVGMQVGWLPGPAACTIPHPFVMGRTDNVVVQCNVVTWSLFGLSLAAYNALLSIAAAAIAAFCLRKKDAA